MSVTPVDEPPGIWRRLARALDAYFVDRTKLAVPEIMLRRAKQEVARYRMLVHKCIRLPQFQSKQAGVAIAAASRAQDHDKTDCTSRG